jgi:hypothetical protein
MTNGMKGNTYAPWPDVFDPRKKRAGLSFFQESLRIAHQTSDPVGEIGALVNIAKTYLEQGKTSEAIPLLRQALPIFVYVSSVFANQGGIGWFSNLARQ